MVESFPLYWPDGWKRTPSAQRGFGRFRLGFAVARDGLMRELDRMGATDILLSTNVPLKRDGLPYASAGQPEDSGAAVYFNYKGKKVCLACDRFMLVKDNLNAIKHTIDALRGIERWGASDMLERAFRGFAALPGAPVQRSWRETLGFTQDDVRAGRVTAEAIDSRFRELVQKHHPDKGGDADTFREVVAAREAARIEVGA
jgi:hypothetical protein